MDEENPEELQKLAESLEREAQGQQVDLSNGTSHPEDPGMHVRDSAGILPAFRTRRIILHRRIPL